LGLPSLPPGPLLTWLSVLARLAILVSIAAIFWYGLWALPDAINPFSPIELTDTPNAMTHVKLRLLQPRYEACIATIRRRGISIARDSISSPASDCGMKKGLRLLHSGVSYGGDIEASCAEMAALLIWERHVLLPASQSIMGSPVVRVRHYGTYECRNINHAEKGRRSEHAHANAIDIAGFDLADGRTISVRADWGKPTDKGRFLAAVHDQACEIFSGVLGPGYNAFHRDHFHFDMGFWTICR
jgi:hypothetical protein